MPLHALNAAAIASASSSGVAKSLSDAARFCKESRWLAKANQYSSDTIKSIDDDISNNTLNKRYLAQYIAVSTLLHATDGWSYLGRSIQSLMQGDPHRALHMAYYAELRAAMSLLATEGIGVFDRKHFVVDGRNSVVVLPKRSGTHQFAWDALNNWAQSASSGLAFAEVIRPHNRTLEDWLYPVGGGAAVLPQAQSWFKQWGMDLSVIADDRESRNVRSYRPSGLPAPWTVKADDAIGFVTDLWAVLEPSSSSFEALDRHILRLSVASLFRGRKRGQPVSTNPRFLAYVQSVVANQDLSEAVSSQWKKFLTRESDRLDPAVIRFSTYPSQDSAFNAFGVISRATLLLRMATGMTHKLFETAGVANESLDFWRSDVGLSRGFWDGTAKPEAMTDLWSDIAAATTEAEPFLEQLTPEQRNFRVLSAGFGQILLPFGGCERVALWGVL